MVTTLAVHFWLSKASKLDNSKVYVSGWVACRTFVSNML